MIMMGMEPQEGNDCKYDTHKHVQLSFIYKGIAIGGAISNFVRCAVNPGHGMQVHRRHCSLWLAVVCVWTLIVIVNFFVLKKKLFLQLTSEFQSKRTTDSEKEIEVSDEKVIRKCI
jgi:hypothetical protein